MSHRNLFGWEGRFDVANDITICLAVAGSLGLSIHKEWIFKIIRNNISLRNRDAPFLGICADLDPVLIGSLSIHHMLPQGGLTMRVKVLIGRVHYQRYLYLGVICSFKDVLQIRGL